MVDKLLKFKIISHCSVYINEGQQKVLKEEYIDKGDDFVKDYINVESAAEYKEVTDVYIEELNMLGGQNDKI